MNRPTFANLRLDVDDGIAFLRIDRPEKHNALDAATRQALITGLDWADGSDDVRVVVLTGEGGRSFAAGADLSEASDDAARELLDGLDGRRVYDAVAECSRPVVAMIDGYCLGGGCELALACDIRVASSRSRFGQPEIRLGIIPGGGGTQRLPRLVGLGQALRLVLTGAIVDADEALRLGLVELVVPAEELEETTRALCAAMAQHPAAALHLAKEAVRASASMPLADGLALERKLLRVALESPDAVEGIAAFRQKRPPRFGPGGVT